MAKWAVFWGAWHHVQWVNSLSEAAHPSFLQFTAHTSFTRVWVPKLKICLCQIKLSNCSFSLWVSPGCVYLTNEIFSLLKFELERSLLKIDCILGCLIARAYQSWSPGAYSWGPIVFLVTWWVEKILCFATYQIFFQLLKMHTCGSWSIQTNSNPCGVRWSYQLECLLLVSGHAPWWLTDQSQHVGLG